MASGKKQQRLVRFSKFVAKAHGKDQAKVLAEEVDDTNSAFSAGIDGDNPYQDDATS